MNRSEMKKLVKQLGMIFPHPAKKIRCKVCKCKFFPTKGIRKTVLEKGGLMDIGKLYDAYDCPACGCQIVVGQRFRNKEVQQ